MLMEVKDIYLTLVSTIKLFLQREKLQKLPLEISKQLREGGIIVAPLMENGKEYVFKFIKKGGKLVKTRHMGVNFVQLVSENRKILKLAELPKNLSGKVGERNLNELFTYFNIGIQKCNLFNSLKKQISSETLSSFSSVPREMFMPFQYRKNL